MKGIYELIQIFKENKRVPMTFIIVILIFVGWSIIQYKVNNKYLKSPSSIENTFYEDKDEKIKDILAVTFTSKQKKIIDSYSSEIIDLLALLNEKTWISENGNISIRFQDNTSIYSFNGKNEIRPFVVCAMIPNKIVGDGAVYNEYIVAVDDGQKYGIVKIERWEIEGCTPDKWKLTSRLFGEQTIFGQLDDKSSSIIMLIYRIDKKTIEIGGLL